MRYFVLLVYGLVLASCKLTNVGVNSVEFADPTVTAVAAGSVDEASGMADSWSMPGNLWINQDSGSPAELSLLGHDGKVKGTIKIPRFDNRDWEEMAIGPGPKDGTNYIYIGEIGDNLGQNVLCQIYRMSEPATLQTAITDAERINFKYPDGARDAEAMFVDPQTKDIYIISKREENVHLYSLPYPQNINEVATATAWGEIPMTFVTGAAISPDGSEIIVRSYTEIRYWKREAGQSVADALQKGTSRLLPYRVEPQGEAVCFDKDGKGYFTISERANASSTNLYYYAKK
ncbi:PE-PGRS family protein [Spirosoma sp. BT702]|uniref:PE-PGRS family protein n=1 Tax=Spirosoma profusum TaxID=2771354 RepID=A0A926XWS1_9BACT|nr:PE-PGRS family protein [Spirosoma profusum]MBD2702259.1 PE-PGRS family protein [Spirosoma profusum]